MDSTTPRSAAWPLIVAVILGGIFYIGGKKLERTPVTAASITVTGEGKVTATPTLGEISLGVQTKRTMNADEAMDNLARAMEAVVAAVQNQGVEEEDIRTEQLSMNPIYDWTENGQIFRGFEATQTVRVKVRDLSKVGTIVSMTSRAGANQIGGINFTIDEPEGLREQARAEAIADAQVKAGILADQLGVSLGKLIQYNEGGGYYPPMPYMETRAAMGGASMDAAVPPVPTGTQDVTVSVTLTYEVY